MVAEKKVGVLITGVRGRLGLYLYQQLNKEYNVSGIDIPEFDITDNKKISEIIIDTHPGIVVHAAAYTDVDGCELDSRKAYAVNVKGTENVCRAAKKAGAAIVYISTDYIFDGENKDPYKESDALNPVSVYGKTKLEGEDVVKNISGRYLIVRSSWLYGQGKGSFVEFVIKKSREADIIPIVADKYGSPTYAHDLSSAIMILISYCNAKKSWAQTVNVTNSGSCSWIEYAQKILEYANIANIKISEATPEQVGFKAKRPRNSILDNSKYKEITGELLRPWQEALKEYIKCQGY